MDLFNFKKKPGNIRFASFHYQESVLPHNLTMTRLYLQTERELKHCHSAAMYCTEMHKKKYSIFIIFEYMIISFRSCRGIASKCKLVFIRKLTNAISFKMFKIRASEANRDKLCQMISKLSTFFWSSKWLNGTGKLIKLPTLQRLACKNFKLT